MAYKMEIMRHAVFPVPDRAFKIRMLMLYYLCNNIPSLDKWKDSLFLNWRRFYETMAIYTSEYSFFKSHSIETFFYFFPVRCEFFIIYLAALIMF